MTFQSEYRQKLTSPEKAAALVHSGDWVDYGLGATHPVSLDKALAARLAAGEVTDLNFRGSIAMWQPEVTKIPDAAGKITWNSWHCSGIERKLIEQGIGFYSPMRYSELPRFYRENIERVDVAMVQVAPMDSHGYFNFGISTSHLAAMLQLAKTVIVEVNENFPVCLGGFGNCIHISDVDWVVEGENPPVGQMPAAAPSPVDEAVAQLIVPEIPNGACLQLGIGGMPNAVGTLIAQSDLKDLGIHTEMYVDGFVDMVNAGKITGANKSLDRGRQVFTFAAGTQKLYDYIHSNPAVMAAPVDYVNAAATISQLDNFISINNAVEVDLFGQVSSESAGTRHISGAGGQQDFVLGAYLSKGGKSFICCSSVATMKDGSRKSRITPTLANGTIITATRTNLQYLVTEYGIVNLKGTTAWQRAERIISVAHPDFREELIQAADQMHLWRRSNRR